MKIALLTLAFSLSIAAQVKPCTVKDVPEIRGIKPGMTKAAFYALIDPKSRDLVEQLNAAADYMFLDRAKMKGLDYVRPLFFDDKLMQVRFDYDRSVEWVDTKDFALTVGESLKLPRESWRGLRPDLIWRIKCPSFEVEAMRTNNLIVTDTDAVKAKNKDEADAADAKRRAFKP